METKEAKKSFRTCARDVSDCVESSDEQPLLARAELDVDTEKRVFSGFGFFFFFVRERGERETRGDSLFSLFLLSLSLYESKQPPLTQN